MSARIEIAGVSKTCEHPGAPPGAALQIQWQAYFEKRPKDMATRNAIKAALPGVATRYKSGAASKLDVNAISDQAQNWQPPG